MNTLDLLLFYLMVITYLFLIAKKILMNNQNSFIFFLL